MTMSNRKSITENNDILHLEEVDMMCPLCKKSLLSFGVSRTNKDFQIAHIFPCNPTSSDLTVLKGITPPINIESFENKIALCKDCHWDYDHNKTLDKYHNLNSVKKQLVDDFNGRRNLLKLDLEDEIIDIIRKISSLNDDELTEDIKLNYDAIKVDRKIDPKYKVLKRRIKDDVSLYFGVVRREFETIDCLGLRKFEQISYQMRNAYLKISEREKDKEKIFNHLVSWLKLKTETEDCICQVIISFFIQDCEIYDEITK
ncbi:hypothetical protein BN938_0387 [Mucinivorans hirudinis]|uniref:Uncharacterized protein n=1 Tax=Mucinivorans hirudinis TaxID=1433126 RepID=A0A060R6D5_9BACT|nr:hypothetical protein BN938_0387 [Mucinivorans hirudinis]